MKKLFCVASAMFCLTILAGQSGSQKWVFQGANHYVTTPAVGSDGTIYVANSNSGPTDIDAVNADGTQKWIFSAPNTVHGLAIGADGTVYFGCSDFRLYALNSSGIQKWTYTTFGDLQGSPAIGTDGTIYILSQDKNIYAINPDGTKKWATLLPVNPNFSSTWHGTPAIGANGNIYAITNDGNNQHSIQCFNSDGSLHWTFVAPAKNLQYDEGNDNGYTASVAIATDGTIYLSAGNLFAINPDGTQKWVYTPINNDNIAGPPSLAVDGTIYCGANALSSAPANVDNNLVLAISPSGSGVWAFRTHGVVTHSPAIATDGTIYIPSDDIFGGSIDTALYALNSNGSQLWSFIPKDGNGNIVNSIWSSPVIATDGTVYFGGSAFTGLYAVNGSSPPASSAWPMNGHDLHHTHQEIPPPVITSNTNVTGNTTIAFSYTIVATNNPTSFTATGLPSGLTFDSINGIISGTPQAVGTATIMLTATNLGGTGSATLTLVVSPPPPVVTSPATASAFVGVSFSYTITATGTPFSFTATGLPTGLTLDSPNGIISGTPLAVGTSTVMLGATNANGTGTGTLTLSVTLPPPPVITSATSVTALLGTSFSYVILATNIPSSFTAVGLPAGLITSNGNISGTPSALGVSSVSLTATNAGGTGSATLTLTVIIGQAASISSPLSVVGVLGVPFSYNITANGNPSSFTFSASPLPSGLTLSGSVISGTPTTSGTFVIMIGANNSVGGDTESLSITIADPSSGAIAANGLPDALDIALGVSPTDATSTPFGIPVGVLTPLQVSRIAIKLNFSKAGNDGIMLSGVLPVPANLILNGQPLVVYFGGVIQIFSLDGKGTSKISNNSFKLSARAKKGVIFAQNAKFTAMFSKGDFAQTLAHTGLDGSTTVKNSQKQVLLIILFNSTNFQKTQTVSYTSKMGKMGTAK